MEKGRKLLEELQKPFSSEQIEWRVRAATGNHGNFKVLVVPYITSRTVMQRLDDVCGGYWQSNFDRIVVGDVEAFQCRISIKLEDEWVTRTDASEVTDYESVKGGHSNAFKRAAIHWGIGRYLYNVNSFWVDVKKMDSTPFVEISKSKEQIPLYKAILTHQLYLIGLDLIIQIIQITMILLRRLHRVLKPHKRYRTLIMQSKEEKTVKVIKKRLLS